MFFRFFLFLTIKFQNKYIFHSISGWFKICLFLDLKSYLVIRNVVLETREIVWTRGMIQIHSIPLKILSKLSTLSTEKDFSKIDIKSIIEIVYPERVKLLNRNDNFCSVFSKLYKIVAVQRRDFDAISTHIQIQTFFTLLLEIITTMETIHTTRTYLPKKPTHSLSISDDLFASLSGLFAFQPRFKCTMRSGKSLKWK